ncbi:MAG TPA: hypothetical protein VMT68_12980 [Caulobacteraceae bacterium]|nr:hypothetical protein [Caulobacteraceae bacterium]
MGIGFAIGLFYNVGFFLSLDLQLFSLLTYKDHLATLVIFAPVAIVPILWCIGLRADPVRRRRASLAAGTLAALAIAFWVERGELAGTPALESASVTITALAALLLVVYCAAVLLDRGLRINETPADDAARDRETRHLVRHPGAAGLRDDARRGSRYARDALQRIRHRAHPDGRGRGAIAPAPGARGAGHRQGSARRLP